MNEVWRAAGEVQTFCQSRRWRFCFIGGIAVQRWSDPRQTEDADLTLLTGFGGEELYIDALLTRFREREEGERERAILRRVLFLFSSEGVGIDVALGAVPFEERCITRASLWEPASGFSLMTCSVEDLVVHKAFAARDLDWGDVNSIVMRHGRKLDVEQIWEELRPLVQLKEEPEILAKLQRIFNKHLD